MFNSTPPSPEKTLTRVLKLARMEAWTAMAIGAGGAALFLLVFGDWFSVVVGSLIAGCAGVELRGLALLRQGEARGMRLLVRSQLLLIGTILAYAAIAWFKNSADSFNAQLEKGPLELRQGFASTANLIGATPEGLVALVVKMIHLVLLILVLATLVYQGGMALYYHRRRAIVQEALAARARAAEPRQSV
jgi:hypothetical protein